VIRRESITKSSRRGQAAVETMLLAFMVMVVLLGLVQLFSLTWASQNAHIRAREAAFHGDAYQAGRGADLAFTQPGTSPFSTSLPGPGGNYTVAEDSITPFTFSATASDQSRDDLFGARNISVSAQITSE
jgi:Flp pilus assembly protein TadG